MYSRLEDQEPKGLATLCYVIFLGTFEWGMVIPTLWPLLQRMGSPEMYFGLVIGTFSLTRVICQPIIGALGDRWDFQVLLCSCLLCSALGGSGPWATVEAAYDKISANFAESRRFPWPFVVQWLRTSQRDTLLVAGCGDGRHVQSALDLGFRRIFALDLSEGMLQAAQRRLGDSGESVVFLHGDTRRVPLPDESVQDVLSCAVLHHLPLAESRAALQDFRRLLRPGGRLLASCWDPRAKAVAKRGKPAEDGIEAHAYWVAWRCADGSDVQRWYNLPPLEVRRQSWSDVPGLLLERVELDGDNQVFEWRKLPETGS
ncbi:hypothetical protein AK812_SmicGene24541 [Symbiodinium microadriaticum]|uniref:Methyltransferase type 11 domain-containing protein n=1 Tax=Symbiodinium microadriaticum TaxID=2951 RepID=A0A1Q9DEB3_SYMMI|nr:hypothetical protein AK812_SmicGene24541 [Symbiodinium microadriaticum]CAE7220632.1 unnamed protein product [Symbiodinium microadriaticum]